MVALSAPTPNDTVLEIGPGKGVLTEQLLATGAKVIAIEKDDRLIPYLNELFHPNKESGQLKLVHGDALDKKIWANAVNQFQLESRPYHVIANIPYYITGALLRHFLEHGPQPKTLTFLVQKEVAQQIVARDHKEGILSLSIKAYGDPHMKGVVKRTSFRPIPNVDSAILFVDNISKKRFIDAGVDEQSYFHHLHAGFGAKRKMLINNLHKELNVEKDRLATIFSELQLPIKCRAEDLTITEWTNLSHALSSNAKDI
jgi:16S rRNA (adenine1518-N6/adenine1519-N6)-dimethyltransferase